jgi:predicted RNA binding protein YcfA (HicA-like mRNA interferase family)
MPSARAAEFQRLAARLQVEERARPGSQERWRHQDGRATTIPIHGGRTIGPPLFFRILEQRGIDLETFERLR